MNLKKESMLKNVVSTRASFNVLPKFPSYAYRGQGEQAPSLNTGVGNAARKEPMMYTGTLICGISQLHKSNAVPVISKNEIIEISKMRR